MTCLRQVKYYILVISISLIMSGYFTLSYFMVTNIFKDSESSLSTFDIVGNRGPYLDSLIAFYLQSVVRKREIYVEPSNATAQVNSIDYYYQMVQDNEGQYNDLRKNMPKMVEFSQTLIAGLESQTMCDWLIDDVQVKKYSYISNNKTVLITQCENAASKILQLGLQQTTNSILQNIL